MDRQYRRNGHSPATAILILGCIILGIFLLCSSSFGQNIAENYIAPAAEAVMNFVSPTETPKAAEAMSTVTGSPAPEHTVKTVEWELSQSSWYLLEMGTFTYAKEAADQSAYIQSMGAAGYLYTDPEGRIRLLAAGYGDQESLLLVQKQIVESGFTASPYNFHLAGLRCRLTGEEKELAAIEAALNIACELPALLTDYALRFDRENLSVQVAREQLNQWLETLTQAESVLRPHGQTQPLEAFCTYIAEAQSALSTFLQKDATIGATECAAVLKHTQIAVLVAYKTLTEGLVA